MRTLCLVRGKVGKSLVPMTGFRLEEPEEARDLSTHAASQVT